MKVKCILVIAVLLMILSGCGNVKETERQTNGDVGSSVADSENADIATVDEDREDQTNEDNASWKEENNPMLEIYRMDITGEWGDEAFLEDKENDEWVYAVLKKGEGDIGCVHIYQYKGTDRNIVVPESLDGYPVTQVLDARSRTDIYYGLEYRSFTRSYNSNEITNIQFPDTVYRTYDDIFEDTVWYENQPDGEIYIGNVFYKYKGEMPSGTTIELREGTLSICEMAFFECEGLERIIMPDSLIWLDDYPFSRCTSLKEVQLSKNLLGMRMYVFADATSLTELYVPDTLLFTFQSLDRSSIEKVYFEGEKGQWRRISTGMAFEKRFDVEFDVGFPYD